MSSKYVTILNIIDTLELLYELKEAFEPSQADRLARVIGRIYRELATTVTKVEFEELRKTVAQLADNIRELAEAQRRTETELKALIKEHTKTREMLAGIADTVGYGLEDKIIPYMEDFAKRSFD